MVGTEVSIQGLVVGPTHIVDEVATSIFTKLDVVGITPAVHLVPPGGFEETHSEVGHALQVGDDAHHHVFFSHSPVPVTPSGA
jgi:hypothetical protein